ncbi:unnamed protein product [Brassica oleracea var. botrytis]
MFQQVLVLLFVNVRPFHCVCWCEQTCGSCWSYFKSERQKCCSRKKIRFSKNPSETSCSKTNELAGDGTTTSVVLAQGLIAEGARVMAADANPVLNYQKNREYHQGSCCRVEEDVKGDSELADVAVVSSGNNYDVGNMIAKALAKIGFKGVFTLEEGKSFVVLLKLLL